MELLTAAQWRLLKGQADDQAMEVEIDGAKYYFDKHDAAENEAPAAEAKRRRVSITPASRLCKELRSEIAALEQRIRRLESIRGGDKQGEDMKALASKWRRACRAMIKELESEYHSNAHQETDHDQGATPFGLFMEKLGIDENARRELGYDPDEDDFNSETDDDALEEMESSSSSSSEKEEEEEEEEKKEAVEEEVEEADAGNESVQ